MRNRTYRITYLIFFLIALIISGCEPAIVTRSSSSLHKNLKMKTSHHIYQSASQVGHTSYLIKAGQGLNTDVALVKAIKAKETNLPQLDWTISKAIEQGDTISIIPHPRLSDNPILKKVFGFMLQNIDEQHPDIFVESDIQRLIEIRHSSIKIKAWHTFTGATLTPRRSSEG